MMESRIDIFGLTVVSTNHVRGGYPKPSYWKTHVRAHDSRVIVEQRTETEDEAERLHNTICAVLASTEKEKITTGDITC